MVRTRHSGEAKNESFSEFASFTNRRTRRNVDTVQQINVSIQNLVWHWQFHCILAFDTGGSRLRARRTSLGRVRGARLDQNQLVLSMNVQNKHNREHICHRETSVDITIVNLHIILCEVDRLSFITSDSRKVFPGQAFDCCGLTNKNITTCSLSVVSTIMTTVTHTLVMTWYRDYGKDGSRVELILGQCQWQVTEVESRPGSRAEVSSVWVWALPLAWVVTLSGVANHFAHLIWVANTILVLITLCLIMLRLFFSFTNFSYRTGQRPYVWTVSSVTCRRRRSVVSSGFSGFLHQKTDFIIIISPPWYDPGCCWGVKPQ